MLAGRETQVLGERGRVGVEGLVVQVPELVVVPYFRIPELLARTAPVALRLRQLGEEECLRHVLEVEAEHPLHDLRVLVGSEEELLRQV